MSEDKMEKIIKGFESCIIDVYDEPCNCPYDGDGGCIGSLMRDALALLKAQEPRVMTLMEACGAEVCWIEKRVQPVITVCKVKLYAQEDYSAFINYMLPYANENIPIGEYGEKWRCWNVRPTYEQREAVKWE